MWLLNPITNLDVVLSPGTAGTGIWAEKLIRKMWQSNIKDRKRYMAEENCVQMIIWDFSYLSQHEGEKLQTP